MRLREDALYAYLQARSHLDTAATHLGVLEFEYEEKRAAIMKTKAEWQERLRSAVYHGLIELGVPADDKKRHFIVDEAGIVFELVGGERRIFIGSVK